MVHTASSQTLSRNRSSIAGSSLSPRGRPPEPWVTMAGPPSVRTLRRTSESPEQRQVLLTSASATAAAGHPDRRLFSGVPAPARRWRPAIDRWPVLHEPHIGTQGVAGQVLLPRVAPELAGVERRIAAHGQQRLVARVGLRPPRKPRQIVVALNH